MIEIIVLRNVGCHKEVCDDILFFNSVDGSICSGAVHKALNVMNVGCVE